MHNGQSKVERGFSINDQVMTQNMSELSLVSKRLVRDYLKQRKIKTKDLEMTPGMLKSASNRYRVYLSQQKQKDKK